MAFINSASHTSWAASHPNRLQNLLGVLFCSLLITACASAPPRERSLEETKRCEEALPGTNFANQSSAFSAEIRMQASGKEEFFLEGTLLASAPDKLRADIFSPLGTLLVIAVADSQTIAVAAPQEQTFYRGRASRARMAKAFFLPIIPSEMVGILRGDPQALYSGWVLEGCFKNKDGVEYLFSQDKEFRRLQLDNQQRLVFLTEHEKPKGEAELSIAFHYSGKLLTMLDVHQGDSTIKIEIVSRQERRRIPNEMFQLTPTAGMRVWEMF